MLYNFNLKTTLISNLSKEIGELEPAGKYPEQYHQEAAALLEQVSDKGLDEYGGGWADLMVGNGKLYAVWADSPIFKPTVLMQYIELTIDDCPFIIELLKK